MKRIRYPIAVFVPVISVTTVIAVAAVEDKRPHDVVIRYFCWMMSRFNITRCQICWCSVTVVVLRLLD